MSQPVVSGQAEACPLFFIGVFKEGMSRNLRKSFFVFFVFWGLLAFGSFYWQLSPAEFLLLEGRMLTSRILGVAYKEDQADARKITSGYYHGKQLLAGIALSDEWLKNSELVPGFAYLEDKSNNPALPISVPFVYEKWNAPFLSTLRQRYHLDAIRDGSQDEFSAMLEVAKWVGTRWDHGVDPLPAEGMYDPLAVLKKSEHGNSYWCVSGDLKMSHSWRIENA